VNGKQYGIVAKANSKSVVWYDPARFAKLKVQPAATWAQLLAVTKKIKAAGDTPWAVGGKDSWTLTDWFENVYARTAGVNKYQGLFTGKVPFNDPSVVKAVQTMTQIVNGQYVPGGIDGILGTAFVDGIGLVFGTKPKADLYMEGGFVGGIALSDVNKKLKPDKTIKFFPFPTITASNGNPLVGGGDIAVAFKKSDATKQLMEYLGSAEAGKIWVSTGAIVSPNRSVPASAYPNPLVRAEAKQVATAKAFVFDGSDLLPGTLGDDWGTTLQNLVKKPADAAKILKSFASQAKTGFQNASNG
jgi:alpha-glucoside transport system substrate-binding protein